MVIAHKLCDDLTFPLKEITKVFKLFTAKDLANLELEFLKQVDYNLYINRSVFTKFKQEIFTSRLNF